MHLLLAAIAFAAVVLGTRLTTRALARDPQWLPVLRSLAVLSWGALVPILLLGRAHLRLHSLGGLYEKLFLAVELAWFLLAAVWVATIERAPTSPIYLFGASPESGRFDGRR